MYVSKNTSTRIQKVNTKKKIKKSESYNKSLRMHDSNISRPARHEYYIELAYGLNNLADKLQDRVLIEMWGLLKETPAEKSIYMFWEHTDELIQINPTENFEDFVYSFGQVGRHFRKLSKVYRELPEHPEYKSEIIYLGLLLKNIDEMFEEMKSLGDRMKKFAE